MGKVYLHFEGTPDFTYVLKTPSENVETVSDAMRVFAAAYASTHPTATPLCAENASLTNDRGKAIDATSPIKSLKKGQDYFVVLEEAPRPPAAQSSGKAAKPGPKKASAPAKTSAALPTAGATVASSDEAAAMRQLLTQSLEAAADAQQKGSYRHALKIYSQILDVVPQQVDCHVQIGRMYSSAGQHERALEHMMKAVAASGNSREVLIAAGKIAHEAKKFPEAVKLFQQALAIDVTNQVDLNDVKVLIGKTLYARGDQDAAISIFVSVLQATEQEDTDALMEYAIACYDRQKYDDCLKVMLRLLVADTNNKIVRAYITDCVRDGGLPLLYQELAQASDSPEAVAFLALLVKDYGALEESAALYRRAWHGATASSTYILNLVHGEEICYRMQDAIDTLVQFLAKNPRMEVGGVTCKAIHDVVKDIKDLSDVSPFFPSPHAIDGDALCNKGPLCTTGGKSAVIPSPPLPELDGDRLDLLALYCTAVKIFYSVGALGVVSRLIPLIETARAGRELHQTTIRNEHAYYCCIAQLMPYHTIPLPDAKPLYIAGDSHSMTPAWQSITVKGEDRVLVPKLVTGLKAWHLRDSSRFYPKMNFWNVINSVPDGEEMIFMFGEIDCREGFIVSIEKLRYETLEEACDVSIAIYLKVLAELCERKRLTIYVHPIVPVLNETRHIVKVFNKRLRKAVMKERTLQWLDFFDELLAPDNADKFREEYKLDGTHMNPSYLTHLQDAFNAL